VGGSTIAPRSRWVPLNQANESRIRIRRTGSVLQLGREGASVDRSHRKILGEDRDAGIWALGGLGGLADGGGRGREAKDRSSD